MEINDAVGGAGPRLMLVGEFDVRSAASVRSAIYDRLDDGGHDLVVDLTGVTSIDLVALRVLAVATRFAQRRGRRLTLTGCGPGVLRLLHLSHLSRLVVVDRGAGREAYQP